MPPASPREKGFGNDDPGIADYVRKTFGGEDALLAGVRTRAIAGGLPSIHVSPFDGLLLEVLTRATGARKIVEIGTLAGYSGVCLARGLPEGGVLHTFEYEPKHAKVAAETFRLAGVDKKVHIHVGPALENLPKIEKEGPFDLVFIDADKPNYPHYVRWARKNLRIGGVALADNSFAWGLVTLPPEDKEFENEVHRVAKAAIDETNRILADVEGGFRGAMVPTGEGLAMGVRVK